MIRGLYCLGIALLFCSASAAGERCGAEAKLLVSPRDVQNSVAALHAGTEPRGEVYLFDTEGLELLSQGVSLRLRTGAQPDLTVKVRSAKAEELKDPSEGIGIFKCEVDFVGEAALTSHSLRTAWRHQSIPQTGEALHEALSVGQLRFLAVAGVSVDWHRVKQMAMVQATAWEVRMDRPPKKVTVELWEWLGGKILELSAKADPQKGTLTMGQLREMAVANGLAVEKNQEPKTSLVLHGPTGGL